jgi:hypothetical protein
MVRGGPVKRTRDVRVRLTPAERASTGRRELGAWVRAVVNELLGPPTGEPGAAGRDQVVDVAA